MVAQMVKNLPAIRETKFRSLSPEDPWRREWQTTPVFLPGDSHGQSSLVGYSPWDRTESDMTERLTLIFSGLAEDFFFFWPHLEACGILSPRTGIGPEPLAMKAQSLNHLTTREFA